MTRRAMITLALLAGLVAARKVRAQDRFEIQVYDSETAPQGGVGVETHVNAIVRGTTQPSAQGEAPTDRQTHLTFEPHVGVASWCELGAYLQTAYDADGSAHFGGFKLRFKMRLPRRYARGIIGLALNLEFSDVPARYEANVYGSELRPIIDFMYKRLYASFNPIVDIDLAGTIAGRPQLQPAAKISVTAVRGLAFGLEYYANFGAVTRLLPGREETHRLFVVADIVHSITKRLGLSVNLGAGYNLTGEGDRWVVKAIIGLGE